MAMRVVIFTGGVGGAKLVLGLYQALDPQMLTVVVNTGDDFWHYGLRICPDIDTTLYTLSGRVNRQFGWGVADDTRNMLAAMSSLGEETWFGLGDRDLATHLLRLKALREGQSLTQIVRDLTRRMGVQCDVLPMCDQFVETKVHTHEHGVLDFQEYFVKHRWQPAASCIEYSGSASASVSSAVAEAVQKADALIIAPSNPWLSVEPILQVPGMRELIRGRRVPRIAVSPIAGGKAFKGPTAKLMGELGLEVSSRAVARYYADLMNGFIYDETDGITEVEGLRVTAMQTWMETDADKKRLALQVLHWAESFAL
jgi:LPPG:FO 2-phospho-L-lactate transferase